MVKVEFTDEYQKILWQISLFKDMDVSLQRRLPLELELSVYEVARKEVVLKQDTYCNHLYVLLKGELEVNIVDVAGNLVKVSVLPVLLPHPICLAIRISCLLRLLPAKILFC